MTQLEMGAEAKAELYIKLLDDTPENLAKAKEDFINGYLVGAQRNHEEREFIIRQLMQMIDLGAQYDEFYMLSIARYTLEKLK